MIAFWLWRPGDNGQLQQDVCIPTSVQYINWEPWPSHASTPPPNGNFTVGTYTCMDWAVVNQTGMPSNVVSTSTGNYTIEEQTVNVGTLSLHWLIVAFHALSFVFQGLTLLPQPLPLLGGYLPWLNYLQHVSEGRNPLRFVEYAASASIMLVCISLLNGIRDQNELLLISVLCAVTQLLGYVAEHANYLRHKKNNDPDLHWIARVLHGLGWVCLLTSYGIITRYFILSVQNNATGVAVPSFVYLILFLIAALYMGFGVVQMVQIQCCRGCPSTSPETIEMAYTSLSLGAKTLLGWIIYVNVLVMSRAC